MTNAHMEGLTKTRKPNRRYSRANKQQAPNLDIYNYVYNSVPADWPVAAGDCVQWIDAHGEILQGTVRGARNISGVAHVTVKMAGGKVKPVALDSLTVSSPAISVDPEFKALIPALTTDEYTALEESLLSEGCRDALVVWAGHNLLVDGHNRYELCTRHNLPYKTVEREFDTRADVTVWMLKNQLGRRNLPEPIRIKLARQLKPALVEQAKERSQENLKRGKDFPDTPKSAGRGETRSELAKSAGVGKTKFSEADYVFENASAYIQDAYEAQEISAHRAYELTKALEKVSAGVYAVCEQYEVKDPQLVRLLEEKKHTDTYAEVVASGRIQFNGEDDPRDKWLSEATAWDFQGLLKEKEREYRKASIVQKQQENLNAIRAQPEGVYSVVYADPPWQYDNSGLYGAAEAHYPTMPVADICALPETIGLEVAEKAVLFLWATNPLLPEALDIIKAWGFQYKTNIAWDKEKPTTGLGFYVRGQHELLMIATRGETSFTPLERPVSVIRSAKAEHSRKPALYSLIENMYPEQRYIELFARQQPARDRWTFWGNEACSDDQT